METALWKNLKRKELSRDRIELSDGQMGDLVTYDIEGYGRTQFVENLEVSSGEFRRVRSMIPFKFIDKKASDFNWKLYEDDLRTQRKIVNSFINNFERYRKQGLGIYLWSKTKGSGKTLLSCCLANEIMERFALCVKFISVPELIKMTKESYKDFAKEGELEAIRNSELLILDDIGAEVTKEWIDTELFRLIDFRNSSKKVTIFTSNLEIDKLELNDRIVDRINEMCIVIHLPEQSIRKMQVEEKNMSFLSDVLKNVQ